MLRQDKPFIPREKQLGWACKLGGVECLGISKAGQTVLARLMETQIWHQPTSFVVEGLSRGTMASALPNTRHFNLSLYSTGALQAAIPVLEPRGSDSE